MRASVVIVLLGACGGSAGIGGGGGDAPTALDARPAGTDPCIAAGTCPPGTWIDVTPAGMKVPEFGPGPVVADPARPSDLYLGGGGDGVWKSVDYGNTWARIDDQIGYVPMGLVLAVAGTDPATVWIAGDHILHRSRDGGARFEDLPNALPASLYSLAVDPYDPAHLISGLHEADGLVESIDGGVTWSAIGGAGFPAGGISWYPFFLDTGAAATTRGRWLAIAQDGGSVTVTRDGGATWAVPAGIDGLQHPHGNAQIFQRGERVFVAGVAGPGQGVYRSDDGGGSFTRVLDGAQSIVWGTDTDVYTMWGWACAGCDLGAGFHAAPLPGDAWTAPPVPADLPIGANQIAVTRDATHAIFVGTMWSAGIWRYVAP